METYETVAKTVGGVVIGLVGGTVITVGMFYTMNKIDDLRYKRWLKKHPQTQE